MEEIEKMWAAFEEKPFPMGHRTKQVQGYNLTMLESEVGGLIMTCLRGDGTLGRRQYLNMGKFCQLLPKVVSELEGEGKEYFNQLFTIAEKLYSQIEVPEDLDKV